MTENGTPLPLLSRYAIMIDVGYIYASTGELLFSASYRHEYRVDAADLIRALSREASEKIRGELLRVYWYDAARDRVPTFDQRVIARAITDAVLVAGDEDMVPAVEAAQAYGVRVHLWGIEPPYGTNQAERLVWESDTVHVLERAFLEPYFSKPEHPADSGQPTPAGSHPRTGHVAAPRPTPAVVFGDRPGPRPPVRPAPAMAPPPARLGPDRERVEIAGEHVAQKWILTRGEDNIRDLLPGPILPPVIDKELLVDAEKELGQSLRAYQEAREWLRDAFWARVHRQFGLGVGQSKN